MKIYRANTLDNRAVRHHKKFLTKEVFATLKKIGLRSLLLKRLLNKFDNPKRIT